MRLSPVATVCAVALFAVCSHSLRILTHTRYAAAVAQDPIASGADSNARPLSSVEVQELLIAGSPPKRGFKQASVTVAVFEDYECPFCRNLNALIKNQLLPMHSTDVSVVYRYLPLPQHPWARQAADMAECVNLQDTSAFWRFGDFLYANQDGISASTLRPRAEAFVDGEVAVNATLFDVCVDTRASKQQVDYDIRLASILGVRSTPTVFVNGIRLHGVHELQQLEDAVQQAQDKSSI